VFRGGLELASLVMIEVVERTYGGRDTRGWFRMVHSALDARGWPSADSKEPTGHRPDLEVLERCRRAESRGLILVDLDRTNLFA
jgi:hypothetical protein